MKILIINLPFSGHISPTIGFAKILIQKGHQVTYILSKPWKKQIEALGASFVSYDNYPDDLSLVQTRRQSFKAAYDTALRIGGEFDCIAYEMLFFLGKELCDKLKKPSVRLFSTFAVNKAIAHEVMHTGGLLMGLFAVPFVNRLFTKWLVPDRKLTHSNVFEYITKETADYNFVYTTKQFQIDSKDFQDEQFKFIGPSIFQQPSELKIDFDNVNRPIIYISLGTLYNRSLSFFRKCIKAFENKEVAVIMSVGQNIDVVKLGEIPENFKIFRSVPQLEVLQHARLFITHGGMNSVNEAMYFGVSMIVVPVGADQPMISKRIESLKLGKSLYKKKLSSKLLWDTTVSVLKDQEIQDHVLEMKQINQNTESNYFAEDFLQKSLQIRASVKGKQKAFVSNSAEQNALFNKTF